MKKIYLVKLIKAEWQNGAYGAKKKNEKRKYSFIERILTFVSFLPFSLFQIVLSLWTANF